MFLLKQKTRHGSWSKTFDLIGSDQIFVARVRSGQPSLVWVWKISPNNPKFSIFSLRIKKIWAGQKVPGSKTGEPVIYRGSKVCSGQVRSEPISTKDRDTELCI